MRPLLALLGSPRPVLDTDTADRLLAGRPVPATAPPGYAEVAKLVMAASGPAVPEELAGEAAAIAAFRALAHAHPPTPTSRRAAMPRKFFSVKAAAAVTVAVLSLAGVAVAATTSRSTGPAEQAAAKAASAPRGGTHTSTQGGGADANGPDATGSARHGLCQAWQSGQGASNGGRLDSTAFQALATAAGGAGKVAAYCKAATGGKDHAGGNGPDATGAARDGLCQAWQSGQSASHGGRQDSAAFQALATAAGGADKIAAYCKAAAATQGQGQGSRPDDHQPPSGGQPPSGDHGNSQGGPPTTTG